LDHNVGNNHKCSVPFFGVEIENTADKGNESFCPAPTGLNKWWLIKYPGLLNSTHNDVSP
jgi:hypothetical protein